jgi:hypothetical protein
MKTIKIKLIEPTPNKLAFVKLIKDCSGLGLREAKDLCDDLHSYPEIVRDMPVRDWETYDYNTGKYNTPSNTNYAKKFATEIKNVGGRFIVNGGVQWERDVKMLQLGIAEKSDYTEFMKDYILNKFDNSEELLTFVLDKFSKEDLQEIFNKTNIEI